MLALLLLHRRRRCRAAGARRAPVRRPPAVWNPAAAYITAGQDEPGYRSWYLAAPWRAAQVKAFNDYLATLRRSAASCRPGSCCAPRRRGRSAAASRSKSRRPSEWPHIVQTLRYIHDYVVPAVGPVEPVSGYRNPIAQPVRGRRAGKRAQALFGDRHGAAAADRRARR